MPSDEAHAHAARSLRHEFAYGRYLLRHGILTALAAVLVGAGMTWAEGRSVSPDVLRLGAVAILGAAAGCCLATVRILRRSLRRDDAVETSAPQAQAIRRQMRIVTWAGILLMAAGFALLLLAALSIGCDRPAWIDWLPRLRR